LRSSFCIGSSSGPPSAAFTWRNPPHCKEMSPPWYFHCPRNPISILAATPISSCGILNRSAKRTSFPPLVCVRPPTLGVAFFFPYLLTRFTRGPELIRLSFMKKAFSRFHPYVFTLAGQEFFSKEGPVFGQPPFQSREDDLCRPPLATPGALQICSSPIYPIRSQFLPFPN